MCVVLKAEDFQVESLYENVGARSVEGLCETDNFSKYAGTRNTSNGRAKFL